MTIYIFYIMIALQALFVGFIAAWFSKKLDNYLRYGEIFGEVRLKIVLWFAKRNGIAESAILENLNIKNYIKGGQHFKEEISPFDNRQKQMKAAYWNVAFFAKWVTPFICVKCMSEYINFFFTISFFLIVKEDFNYQLLLMPVFWVMTSTTTYYFINRK